MQRRWWWSGDRENDIYSCFARRPVGVDLIVRAAQDRALLEDASLFASATAWPELTQMRVKVAPRRVGDPGRIATVALRAGPVTLKRPRNGFARTDPEMVSMTLVEAREINPPTNEEPLCWRLLTTIEAGDAAAAREIVRFYRLRWRIEEVFRALKSDGMRLEETQVHEARRLFKLAVVGLAGACRTIQLVDGTRRQSKTSHRRDRCRLAARCRSHRSDAGRQNRTAEKPPPASFSRMAGLDRRKTRRLNCYYKPPGPKTMSAGWAQFATMTAGFTIATALQAQSNVRIP